MLKRREFLSLTAAALPLSACEGIDTAEWTEQVMLHDRRVIEVGRRARAHHSGFPNARRGSNIDFELWYEPMKVHWKEGRQLELISFDIFDDVPYIAAAIDLAACGNKPKSDYAARFFRRESLAWKEIPQASFPIDTALLNLYRRFRGNSADDDAKGLVTWQMKADRDGFDAKMSLTIKGGLEKNHYICLP